MRDLPAVNSYWFYLKFYPNAKVEAANLRYVRKKHQVQLKLISFYCVQRKVMRIGHKPSQNLSSLETVFVFPESAFRDLSTGKMNYFQENHN